jgi:purine-binding chemotaxis protein CheW
MDISEIRKKAKKLREKAESPEAEKTAREKASKPPPSSESKVEGGQRETETRVEQTPVRTEERAETVDTPGVEPGVGAQPEPPAPPHELHEAEGAEQGLPKAEEHVLEAVTFMLDSEEYAVDIYRVQEVIKQRKLTEVPTSSTHIIGVLSLRGSTVPVMNLRGRLGLPEKQTGELIIIVKDEEDLLGFLVDSIRRVVRVPVESLEPPPPLNTIGVELISAIGRDNDEPFIILEIDKVLEGV